MHKSERERERERERELKPERLWEIWREITKEIHIHINKSK